MKNKTKKVIQYTSAAGMLLLGISLSVAGLSYWFGNNKK